MPASAPSVSNSLIGVNDQLHFKCETKWGPRGIHVSESNRYGRSTMVGQDLESERVIDRGITGSLIY